MSRPPGIGWGHKKGNHFTYVYMGKIDLYVSDKNCNIWAFCLIDAMKINPSTEMPESAEKSLP
jgi:hypothetical protein